jgi:hypothetical protein
MVVGKDMIYFTLSDADDVVDCIPLAEITQVKKMGSDAATESHQVSLQKKGSTHPHPRGGNDQISSEGFHQTLRIDTKQEGYNSGRAYYLKISTEAEFLRLAISLTSHVKDAIKRFEAKSSLEKSQTKIRRLFRSPTFQFTAAFFILAVKFPHSVFHSYLLS